MSAQWSLVVTLYLYHMLFVVIRQMNRLVNFNPLPTDENALTDRHKID